MERGRFILLVDDNADIRSIFGDLLADEGYVVETARDGLAALQTLERFPADLLLTDLQMPGMDGIQLIRRVHAKRRDIPAVLLTASRDADPRIRMNAAGASAVLIKPVELDDLLTVLTRVLDAKSSAEVGAFVGTEG